MPQTVPNKPTNGAVEPTDANTAMPIDLTAIGQTVQGIMLQVQVNLVTEDNWIISPSRVNTLRYVYLHHNLFTLPANYQLNIPRMFAALVLISLTGVAVFSALAVLSRWALGGWHESELSPEH